MTTLKRRDFMKLAAAGAATTVVSPQIHAQSGDINPILNTYPTLTSNTRDWRWGRLREMMADNNVEALLVMDPAATRYITETGGSALMSSCLFPIEGDPVEFAHFGHGAMTVDQIMKGEEYGIETWVPDQRLSEGTPDHIVAELKAKGLEKGRIGTFGVGATGHFRRRTNNWSPGGLSRFLTSQLPGLSTVELWNEFMQLWLVKNDEEQAMFRKAAAGIDLACQNFIDTCQPGNSLADLKLAAMTEPTRHGLEIWLQWFAAGPDGGREMHWLARGIKPPVIQAGDLVVAEFSVRCGSMDSQTCISVSVGEPRPKVQELAQICRDSYDAGMDALKPGMVFQELADVMAEPLKKAGAWQMSPLIHTLNPTEAVTAITVDIDGPRGFPGVKERFFGQVPRQLGIDRPELVLEENMGFQIEPNAAFEKTFMNTGANLILHADGPEELNPIAGVLHVVDA